MSRNIVLGWLAASGLFAFGWALGVALHRHDCEETQVNLAQQVFKQATLLAQYEADLAERDQRVAYLEQVNAELKDLADALAAYHQAAQP